MTGPLLPKPEPRAPKPRARIPKRSPHAVTELEAETLMGRVVKAQEGRCQACGSTERRSLTWAHGFGKKAYPALKFDRDNSFCLCLRCHDHYAGQPTAWDAFMWSRLGGAVYVELRRRGVANERPVLVAVVGYLRAMARRLCVLTDEQWTRWLEGDA